MIEFCGKKYFSAEDLRIRYGYGDKSSVSRWHTLGILPNYEITYSNNKLWSVESIEKWEEEHGGNTLAFKLWARGAASKVPEERDYYSSLYKLADKPNSNTEDNTEPLFMFATVPPAVKSESEPEKNNDDDEIKPVAELTDYFFSNSQKTFDTFFAKEEEDGESNPFLCDQPDKSSNLAAPEEKVTRSSDDSDIEFFALQEKVIKLDGDIAELRANYKELLHAVMTLAIGLNNSTGILSGRVSNATEKLRQLDKFTSSGSVKLEGTDE